MVRLNIRKPQNPQQSIAKSIAQSTQMTIDDIPDDTDIFLEHKDTIGNINEAIMENEREKQADAYAFEQWKRNITLARDALLTSDMYIGVARNFASMPEEYRKLAECYGQLTDELDRLEGLEYKKQEDM